MIRRGTTTERNPQYFACLGNKDNIENIKESPPSRKKAVRKREGSGAGVQTARKGETPKS